MDKIHNFSFEIRQKPAKKANWGYLMSLTLTCGFSSIELGATFSASNAAWKDLEARFDLYDVNPKVLFSPKTLVSAASILGAAVGSIIGGQIIGNGRRRPIIIFNVFIIIGSLMAVVDNFKVICLGRLVFGFATGVLLSAAPKVIEETVPADIADYGFGASTNLIANFGVLVNFSLGSFVPLEPEKRKTD